VKRIIPLALALPALLVGCAPAPPPTPAPESRPLGKELGTGPSAPEPSGPVTLRQALALALMNSPELAAASYEVRAAGARALQASFLPNPEVELEAEEFGGPGDLSGFDAAEVTLGFSQLFELGDKRAKRMRVSALETKLSGWDFESKRLDVFTATAQAYVELLAAQKHESLAKESLAMAQQVLDMTRERVRAGKVSPLQEAKAKVERVSAGIDVARAQRGVAGARKRLAANWGSTSPTFTEAKGDLTDIAPLPPLGTLTQRLEQNPDLARWENEIALRQATLAVERANRIVDIEAGVGISRFNETDDHAFLLGVGIPLPIFDRNEGGIREAEIGLAQAREERRAATVGGLLALDEAYRALAGAHEEATSLEKDVLPLANHAFAAAQESYKEGKSAYLDVLDAKRTLFEARVQHLDALTEYHKARADVERLTAQKLER